MNRQFTSNFLMVSHIISIPGAPGPRSFYIHLKKNDCNIFIKFDRYY